jgi:hypothetical protein
MSFVCPIWGVLVLHEFPKWSLMTWKKSEISNTKSRFDFLDPSRERSHLIHIISVYSFSGRIPRLKNLNAFWEHPIDVHLRSGAPLFGVSGSSLDLQAWKKWHRLLDRMRGYTQMFALRRPCGIESATITGAIGRNSISAHARAFSSEGWITRPVRGPIE